eukprot:5977007-Karenia_brevis.AAC.1
MRSQRWRKCAGRTSSVKTWRTQCGPLPRLVMHHQYSRCDGKGGENALEGFEFSKVGKHSVAGMFT